MRCPGVPSPIKHGRPLRLCMDCQNYVFAGDEKPQARRAGAYWRCANYVPPRPGHERPGVSPIVDDDCELSELPK